MEKNKTMSALKKRAIPFYLPSNEKIPLEPRRQKMLLSKEAIKIINVFSIDDKGGNPCAVVDNADHLSPKGMQSLATHLKLPETVYILRKEHMILLRFFATKKEHPLCYHGALGAAFYLCKLCGLDEINLTSYHGHTSLNTRCENNSRLLSKPHVVNS